MVTCAHVAMILALAKTLKAWTSRLSSASFEWPTGPQFATRNSHSTLCLTELGPFVSLTKTFRIPQIFRA
jgi:hypothetical protein